MKRPAHTITLEPWRSQSFGERLAFTMVGTTLAALQPDARMTILISLLAQEIIDLAATDDEIDAIIDMLRLHLKLKMTDSPPLQGH